jgi:superoxide dismutase
MTRLSMREMLLLGAAVAVGGWMLHGLWIARDDTRPLPSDVAALLENTRECHCGTPALRALGHHAYYEYAEAEILPAGLSPRTFELYQQRHCRGYVDWWNVDEGLLRTSTQAGDAALLRAMGRMRRSAQSVLLGEAHQSLVLGTAAERSAASPTIARIEAAAGSPAALLERLKGALPPDEGWLVLGVDLTTGETVLAHPDAGATEGLWGAYPMIALDFHRTAHVFDFGADREAYLACLWPQLNRVALEERAATARHLAGHELLVTADSLTALSSDALARLNEAALAAASVQITELTSQQVASAVPPPLAQALTALLGPQWPRILERWVALAPRQAVLGIVLDTGMPALFHVGDPTREGVWGVVPVAVFTPDQAASLGAVNWQQVGERWDRWSVAITAASG